MKVWITKYALSSGIAEREAEDRGDGYIRVAMDPERPEWKDFFPRNAYALTYGEACDTAEKMRVVKIASLRKQITKLEKMKF